MKQAAKYILYTVGGLLLVGIAWYLFGAIGSTIAGILGIGAARQQMRSYVEAEAQAEAARDRAQVEHQQAQAEIEAEHTRQIQELAKQHRAEAAKSNAKIEAAKTAGELDDAIDDAVDDLERVIGRPIDTINREGFAVNGLIQWLLLLGLLLALCCRVGYADVPNKHKAQVKRLINAIQAAKHTILKERAGHKRDLAQLTAGHRRELQLWRAELKECQTKKQILAKPQPTWPRDVGFAVAGFAGAALLCGAGLGAASLAGKIKIQ